MTDADRWRDLVHAVRNVRQHQKDYFATRDIMALNTSKDAERSLDKLLETFDGAGDPLPIQSTLFDD